MSESNETHPSRGLKGDIHRARNGAKASAAELREFVREFRGRSPQEMLGLVTGNGLVQATALATFITVVFMAGFTVGPWWWNKSHPVAAKPTKAPVAAPAPATSGTAAAPVAASATAAPLPVATGSGPATPDLLNTLGIGETKVSDPKKNPLEAGGDDLLKDFK